MNYLEEYRQKIIQLPHYKITAYCLNSRRPFKEPLNRHRFSAFAIKLNDLSVPKVSTSPSMLISGCRQTASISISCSIFFLSRYYYAHQILPPAPSILTFPDTQLILEYHRIFVSKILSEGSKIAWDYFRQLIPYLELSCQQIDPIGINKNSPTGDGRGNCPSSFICYP